MASVSIVIPCYNPGAFLFEAVASARAQTGCQVQLVLVNDGSSSAAGCEILERAAPLADRYIQQPNRGLAAARNSGFAASDADFIIPLDSDDLLEPSYAATCLRALDDAPRAAFAYTDYRVFGKRNYRERLADYNLYDLLNRNTLTYAALIRKNAWAECGGYDEALIHGYEDWDFWLRLGERGGFGRHVPEALFRYRKHGPSLFDTAQARHSEIVDTIRRSHPALYERGVQAQIKKRWAPAVCVAGPATVAAAQALEDCVAAADLPAEDRPREAAFLIPGPAPNPDSAELAALAVWGGRQTFTLPDGSVAFSPAAFHRGVDGDARRKAATPRTGAPRALEKLHRHLVNAELLSLPAWRARPLHVAARLIPLRIKERVNRSLGREFFDLSFYLQFQPSTIGADLRRTPLVYFPRVGRRRRIALVTPHLGSGGAERVLLDIAQSLDRSCSEVFLFATHSHADLWRERWQSAVDHVYDLNALTGVADAPAALYSAVVNWNIETLLVQNALPGYSVLPHLKRALPRLKTIDLIHAIDPGWDIAAVTRPAESAIDAHAVISEAVRAHLLLSGIPERKIRLVRTAIDLEAFHPTPQRRGGPHRILFAARLDPVKRPLLLPEIAVRLRTLRSSDDFCIAVAGEGPERDALERRIASLGMGRLVTLLGHIADIRPLLAECTCVILPSRSEGIPLVVLEAFAAGRTVVASAVGGVPEVVTPETGIAIPPGDADAERFAAALHELLDRPQERERLAANGRRLVEDSYSRELFAPAYRSLLEEAPSADGAR